MTGSIGSRLPAGWTRQELAELSDSELLGIVSLLPRFSQRRIAACDLLVSRHRDLVGPASSDIGTALSRLKT